MVVALALLAALTVCAGCNLLAPPPSALPLAAPAAVPAAAPAAVAAPAAPHVGFLGRAACGLRILIDRIRNRLGMRFPGLEAKPPVTSITDPANAESPTPAVATAAEVKAEEDAAPQKIKALRYLATVGCTECYPDIEKALLAALDDCTESVRYEAVKAIRKTAGDPCQRCLATRCCRPEILKRLQKMAYDMRDECCYQESSARVRRLARLVLSECNGEVIIEPAAPPEGPSRAPQGEDAAPVGGNTTAPSIVATPAPPAQLTESAAENPPSASAPAGQDRRTPLATLPDSASDNSPSASQPAGQGRRTPPEVRFEQVTALRNRFRSAEEASQTLEYVRRAALGAPVAPPDGFDPKAIVLQRLDWTRPEELPSKAIARMLLSTPPGQPSGVIEDGDGWHVVLVHQRRPEPTRPLGTGARSLGPWTVDWQTQDYNSAYLERKLFSDTPPQPGHSTRRPTRIVKPQAPLPTWPPLTANRPRRLPEPTDLDSFPNAPLPPEFDTTAGTNAGYQIIRVNGILPVEADHGSQTR